MAMSGYVWLCTVMYGYVWFCTVKYGYICLCMALCIAMEDYV